MDVINSSMDDFVLSPGQDVITGTDGDDRFFANDSSFNPGDLLDGAGGFDVLKLFLAAGTPGGATFAGFEMDNIERFEVTNDKPGAGVDSLATFDMSGVTGLEQLASINSSSPITWTQLTSLVSIDLINTTDVGDSDVSVFFRNDVTDSSGGASQSVDLNVTNTDVDVVTIGSVGTGSGNNMGIETVNLTAVGGSTSIDQLDTDLTTLNIFGAGNIAIDSALNSTVRGIDASGQSGNLTIDFSDNDTAGEGVVFTGSAGVNDVTAGDASDTISTFDGDDVIRAGEGDNVVDAGNGDNTVTAGSGNDFVSTGSGNDTITIDGGNNSVNAGEGDDVVTTGSGNDFVIGFGGNDVIDTGAGDDEVNGGFGDDTILNSTGSDRLLGGAGNDTFVFSSNGLDASNDPITGPRDEIFGQAGFDVIETEALGGSDADDDARLTNVSQVERIVFTSSGDNYLGGFADGLGRTQAQGAGIRDIWLQEGTTNGDDVVDASTFSRNLRVLNFGEGSDEVRTGSGRDTINFFGNLTDADIVDGGAGVNGNMPADSLLLDGSTTLTAANQITGIEKIVLDTGTFTSPNVYDFTLNDAQNPDGGVLQIFASGLRDFGESLTLDASGVTTFTIDVRGSRAADTITTGEGSDEVRAGNGDDVINGNVSDAGDFIGGGAGNDTVNLFSGNNEVRAGVGDDTVRLGSGSDTVFGQGGNDTIVSGNDVNAGDRLDGSDLISGGADFDTLQVNGGGLTDANFTGVDTVENLLVEGTGTLAIGQEAQAGGIVNVLMSNDGASTLDASGYTADLFVDMQFDTATSGDDTVITGAGNDTVEAGIGTTDVTLGAGDDTYIVDDGEFTYDDSLEGGMGSDTVVLDNSDGSQTMTANVDLDTVRNVETFRTGSSGNNPLGNVADTVSLNITGSAATGVGSLTTIAIDNSAMTDALDTLEIRLDGAFAANGALLDDDYQFEITGSDSATTRLVKRNDGIDNNIDFQGGAGVDELQIAATDLGSTITFDGGAGDMDKIIQEDGQITDDGYDNVSNVEILTANFAQGFTVDAVLGSAAAASGLETIIGTDGDDNVVLDAGFGSDLTFDINDGDDTFTGGASVSNVTFVAEVDELTASDVLEGGADDGDVLLIESFGSASATANIDNVTGVETINFVEPAFFVKTLGLELDTNADEVFGGTLTINAGVSAGLGGSSQDAYVITFDSNGDDTDDANIVFNSANDGNDQVTTGGGDDIVNVSLGTLEQIATGAGNDEVNADFTGVAASTGLGDDVVNVTAASIQASRVNLHDGDDTANLGGGSDMVQGDAGNDTINGGAGNDMIVGGGDNEVAGNDVDTIDGGDGDDHILGGLDGDFLTGGAGADIFYYEQVADSSLITGEDTITDFQSGVDRIDLSEVASSVLAAGADISFAGNAANFGDAQSLVTVGSGDLQIVYQQDTNTLWADINDDGTLDGSDLRIELSGVNSLVGADVFDGGTYNGGGAGTFEANNGFDSAFFMSDGMSIVP